MAVTLEPHQEKAVKELDNGRILVGGTGVGKSLTAAAYSRTREADRDVYVITTAKKRSSRDWDKEFAHFGIESVPLGPRSDSGGVGRREGTRPVLRVDSWNNIGKYEDVEDAFFIFDEQRLVGTGAWTKSFYKIAKRNRWILLSATPGDTWLDYAPVFIANGWYKNITQFKEEHVIYAPYVKFPKVLKYSNPGKLVRLRNQIQVQMPYLRHTTRKITWKHVEYRQDLVEEATKNRWNPLEQRPLKDVAELFRVVRRITNTDASRLEAVRQLLHVHPRLIVFYSFDYELDMLRTLLDPAPFVTASATDGSTSKTQRPARSTDISGSSPSNARTSSSTTPSLTGPSGSRPAFPDYLTSRANDSLLRIGSTNYESGSESEDSRSWMNGSSQKSDPSSRPSSRRTERPTSSSLSWEEPSNDGTDTTPSLEVGTDPTQSLSRQDQTATAPDVLLVGSAEGIYSHTQIAEWNGHRHDPVPTGDRWVYLVQYTAGSEGWNCTTTDAMVFWSIPYSYKQWHQAFGRIDRMNTPYSTLYYYVLFSKSWIDLAIRKSLMAKKNFNESASGVKF